MGGALLLGTFALHAVAGVQSARVALRTRKVPWLTLALSIGLLIIWRLMALYDVLVASRAIDVHAELLAGGISLLAIAGIAGAKRQEALLRETERRFASAAAGAMDAIVLVDATARVIYANRAAEELFGRSSRQLLGGRFHELVPNPAAALDRTRAELGAGQIVPLTGVHADGRELSLEATIGEHLEASGRVLTLVLRDVSERQRLLSELSLSEQRYAVAAKGAGVGLWDWQLDSGHVYYSPRFVELLGYEPDANALAPTLDAWLALISPADLPAFRSRLVEHVSGLSPEFDCEYRVRMADGRERWMRARGLAIREAGGRATRMAGSQIDVTEQKRTEERLTHGALHDALTGLPNRALLCDRIQRCIAKSRRRPHKFAVLSIDLDRMKLVNDGFGHAAGDELLMDVARKLHVRARPGDTVARIDGDQFAVLLEDLAGFEEANEVAERVSEALSLGVTVRDHELVVTATIGIATSQLGFEHADELLRAADAAMYRAKDLGGARHELFSDTEVSTGGKTRLTLEADLRRAVTRGEIVVHYQPIVSLVSGRVGSFEALVRWQHPSRGLIGPGEFVAVAEDSGILPEIEQHVLATAAHTLARWQRELPLDPPLSVAVNVSARAFSDDRLENDLGRLLAELEIAPGSLELEITESLLLGNDPAVLARLERLRERGISLSIDDFGTGYSSLSYLHKLPIDAVKVDQSFIRGIDQKTDRAEVVRTILALAAHLGLEAVAEGIETAEELAKLRELGCTWAQGFFFAKPLEEQAAAAQVKREIEVLDASRISGKVSVRRKSKRPRKIA